MKIKALTYGNLSNALVRLGFIPSEGSDYIVFREAEHDAVILLPSMPANDTVLPHHFGTVRMTVTGRGVADEEQFETALAASLISGV